jgi:hypothetical protein
VAGEDTCEAGAIEDLFARRHRSMRMMRFVIVIEDLRGSVCTCIPELVPTYILVEEPIRDTTTLLEERQ